MRSIAQVIADLKYRLPKIDIHHNFHHKPEGPFICQAGDSHLELDLTLDDAFDQFMRYAMPPEGTRCVIDNDGLIVIGYIEDAYGDVRWYGLEAGFDLYRDHRLTHPLEYELAVAQAQRNL